MEILINDDFNALPYNIPAGLLNADFAVYRDKAMKTQLKKLLGLDLYDLFIGDIVADYPQDKYAKLVIGARYEISGVKYEWAGFTEAFKAMVYALHLRDRYDDDTESGIVVSKPENADLVTPALRIVNAYNSFVNMIGNQNAVSNTFYGYMLANKDLYPSWVFIEPKLINRFNL